jgi:hypothetical protein
MFNTITKTIAGGLIVAAIAALAIILWPDSEADKARADGEQLGAAVSSLTTADSEAEAEAALADIRTAVEDSRAHLGEFVGDQVDEQANSLDQAVDGYVGAVTADDEWDQELYELELEYALDDLYDQAEDFRSDASEVPQAYWEGFEEGNTAS